MLWALRPNLVLMKVRGSRSAGVFWWYRARRIAGNLACMRLSGEHVNIALATSGLRAAFSLRLQRAQSRISQVSPTSCLPNPSYGSDFTNVKPRFA